MNLRTLLDRIVTSTGCFLLLALGTASNSAAQDDSKMKALDQRIEKFKQSKNLNRVSDLVLSKIELSKGDSKYVVDVLQGVRDWRLKHDSEDFTKNARNYEELLMVLSKTHQENLAHKKALEAMSELYELQSDSVPKVNHNSLIIVNSLIATGMNSFLDVETRHWFALAINGIENKEHIKKLYTQIDLKYSLSETEKEEIGKAKESRISFLEKLETLEVAQRQKEELKRNSRLKSGYESRESVAARAARAAWKARQRYRNQRGARGRFYK